MDTVRIEAQFCCGFDLHSPTIYFRVMNRDGGILLRRNIQNNFKIFKQFVQPFVPARRIREAGIPFCLAHALYMKKISDQPDMRFNVETKLDSTI
ncbi:MAG: hypothetical protein ACE5IY_18415 [bacterium]